MNTYNLTIAYTTYGSIDELSAEEQSLCRDAEAAMDTSYSPYSNFKVGTAIRLKGGEIVQGSNQENVAYPSGLCAERVALFSIGSARKNAVIEAMAITAFTKDFKIEQPVTSCGACLQVMAEYEKKQGTPVAVLFYCMDGEILKVNSISALMPFSFVEDRLGGRG